MLQVQPVQPLLGQDVVSSSDVSSQDNFSRAFLTMKLPPVRAHPGIPPAFKAKASGPTPPMHHHLPGPIAPIVPPIDSRANPMIVTMSYAVRPGFASAWLAPDRTRQH